MPQVQGVVRSTRGHLPLHDRVIAAGGEDSAAIRQEGSRFDIADVPGTVFPKEFAAGTPERARPEGIAGEDKAAIAGNRHAVISEL